MKSMKNNCNTATTKMDDSSQDTVDSFFSKMTAKQLDLLKLDSANDATEILLAEILLDLVLLTQSILRALEYTAEAVSEEGVLSSLGDTLP